MSELVNNAEKLRDWFRTCPAIQKGNRFRVDFVGDNPTEYSIFSVPTPLKYHENILGDEILDDNQTQNFIFASKEYYGADVQQNLSNLAFYQEIVNWILEQNAARNFPNWDGGTIKSITPTLTGAPIQIGSNAAKYQIQLKVKYRRN